MDKGNWILVVTTVITVSGTIAVAMINQQGKAEKLREPEAAPPLVVRDDPVPVDTDAIKPRVDAATGRLAAAERAPLEARFDDPPEPDPISAPAVVDISGAWHDMQHGTYYVAQQGNAFRMSNPQYPTATASGMISGNAVQWDYRNHEGAVGRCSGMASGPQLQVGCTSMGVSYNFPMHRPSSG